MANKTKILSRAPSDSGPIRSARSQSIAAMVDLAISAMSYCKKSLGIASYDRLIIAGGSACLSSSLATYCEEECVTRTVEIPDRCAQSRACCADRSRRLCILFHSTRITTTSASSNATRRSKKGREKHSVDEKHNHRRPLHRTHQRRHYSIRPN